VNNFSDDFEEEDEEDEEGDEEEENQCSPIKSGAKCS
jgi:hypothetical protein